MLPARGYEAANSSRSTPAALRRLDPRAPVTGTVGPAFVTVELQKLQRNAREYRLDLAGSGIDEEADRDDEGGSSATSSAACSMETARGLGG